MLDETQEGEPTGDPRRRVERQLAGEHVRDQAPEIRREQVALHPEREMHVTVPTLRHSAGRHVGVADLGPAVSEDGVALGVVEGGAVGVVDEDVEVEGDVDLDADGGEGDAWGDAGDAGGNQLGGGLTGHEEGEVEDEDDDAEEEEEEEAAAAEHEAAAAAVAVVVDAGGAVAGFLHDGWREKQNLERERELPGDMYLRCAHRPIKALRKS